MHIPNLEALEHARREIENVVSARYLDQQAVPYFAPTDFGTLPPEKQNAELRNEEENSQGNVARASIHMCLASAIAALQVSEALLRNSGQSSPLERRRVRVQCAAECGRPPLWQCRPPRCSSARRDPVRTRSWTYDDPERAKRLKN